LYEYCRTYGDRKSSFTLNKFTYDEDNQKSNILNFTILIESIKKKVAIEFDIRSDKIFNIVTDLQQHFNLQEDE
jgi:hypothetical protein